MQHGVRLVVKFVACLVVLGIILGMFYDFSFGDVVLISAVLGLLSYFLGDLLLLRRSNNFIASAADFGLTFLVVWFMGRAITIEDDLFSASLISAVAVTAFEYFFHRFLVHESDDRKTIRTNRTQFQTEASEELTPVKPDVRSPENEDE
ncbi:YndM family protein [Neobacillus thermocopriae]|uniref:YndM family protein n=1 Tax=Neobacillus thermocopriae TaxID=1215031 RepID=A0A6B3TP05_9BACI|nr:YndM family protein [Neobacillus thermocopriae]MED3623937.1 YndM family protein [Neobacillus thermocopriae]MED3713868.1 YndM family protein [Neobacillus thermocopriae]NEX77990.1 YndM family protein [Neobacillus thermocopriae]